MSRDRTSPGSAPSANSLVGLQESFMSPWSPTKKLLVHILAALSVVVSTAYICWRVSATISWSAWWISVPFAALEAHLVFRMILSVAEVWDIDRGPTAALSMSLLDG